MRKVLAVLLTTFALAGCGDDPLGPAGGDGPLTALIDGETFVAAFATVSRAGGQVFVNAGSTDMRAIGFQFPDDGVPATYTFGAGVLASAGVTLPGEALLAGPSDGSGTITITVFEADRLEGTFSFVVVDGGAGGGPSSRNITNGAFAIDY